MDKTFNDGDSGDSIVMVVVLVLSVVVVVFMELVLEECQNSNKHNNLN